MYGNDLIALAFLFNILFLLLPIGFFVIIAIAFARSAGGRAAQANGTMMPGGMFGGGASYQGSRLEGLIVDRCQKAAISPPNIMRIAEVLSREHPHLLGQSDARRVCRLAVREARHSQAQERKSQHDYYKSLGLKRGATEDEIKHAFRTLAREHHPDVNKEAGAEARFKQIKEAYEMLGNTEKRVAYDQLDRELSDEPVDDQEFWNGLAFCIMLVVNTGLKAAPGYGPSIDALQAQNSVAAMALTNCLVQYVDATDIPIESSDGGYRRYFSAYLLLRKSLTLFDRAWVEAMRQPAPGITWTQRERDIVRELTDDRTTETLLTMAPVAEQQTLQQVLGGIAQFRSTMGLIPGMVAAMTLRQALTAPETMSTRQWPSPDTAARPYQVAGVGAGTCTFCGGSGMRSGCGGCNGTGRNSRLGLGGEVEITRCLVCHGSGRARCDVCLGKGRR